MFHDIKMKSKCLGLKLNFRFTQIPWVSLWVIFCLITCPPFWIWLKTVFFHCYFCKFCPMFKVGSDDLQTKPHKGHWMDFWFCFPLSNKSLINFMAKPQSKMYMYFSNSLANWNKTLWVSVALYPKSAFNQFYDIKNLIVTSIWLGPNLWFWFDYILPF